MSNKYYVKLPDRLPVEMAYQKLLDVWTDEIHYIDIYDDDGNKINVLDIPVPELCLTCESFLDDDSSENYSCNFMRANKREGEEFVCFGWKERENG
jgi:hypothetical protein